MSFDPDATQRATPPPPPPSPLARLDLALVLALGAAAIVGCGLLVPESWAGYYAFRLWLPVWLFAGVLYGGAHIPDRSPWLTRLTRWGRAKLASWGGGAYAAIALACFLWLEVGQLRDLADWIATSGVLAGELGVGGVVREVLHNLVRFIIDAFMNGIYAVAWPAFWRKAFSAGAQWPAVAVAWAVFESGRFAIAHLVKPESNPPRS